MLLAVMSVCWPLTVSMVSVETPLLTPVLFDRPRQTTSSTARPVGEPQP